MKWQITIVHNRRTIRLKAEQVFISPQVERYMISGSNRSITLQGNRPLLRSKGLKNRRIDCKLTEGQMNNSHLFETIIKKLEEQIG